MVGRYLRKRRSIEDTSTIPLVFFGMAKWQLSARNLPPTSFVPPSPMNSAHSPWLSLILCAAVLWPASTVANAAASPLVDSVPTVGGTVELPEFVVEDTLILPLPETWRYAEIPGFEILSTVSARETRRFVQNLLLLQQVIEVIWPASMEGRPQPPTVLILSNRGRVFESFIPVATDRDADYTTSLFMQDDERAAIVVNFVSERLSLATSSTAAGAPAGEPADESSEELAEESGFMTPNDPYREFYLQYFRHRLRQGAGRTPHWLEEGLVQLLAAMEFSSKRITFGRIDGAFNQQFAGSALMKFDRMFAAERPSLVNAPMYPYQCYAFVHLCLYGEKQRYQEPFMRLVARAMAGPITEEIFKECFGMDYRRMGLNLRGYVEFTSYKYTEFRAKKGSAGLEAARPVELRDATPSEVGRIKGEAYRLAGHDDRARLALIAPYIRGERDPRLLASIGLHERTRGEDARARLFLEKATEAKVVHPSAWLELARLRLEEAGAEVEVLDEAQVQSILAPLLVARTQPPPMSEVYEQIALVWARAEQRPHADDLAVVYEGTLRFPRRMKLMYMAAVLAVDFGRPEDAQALIDYGLEHGDARVRPLFESLKTQLSQ